MTVLPSCVDDACSLARQVRSKRQSAKETALAALERIEKLDPALNCFTSVLRDSALSQAEAVDRRIAAGDDAGPLAGVPFAVKNLFDIGGVTTLAGSKIHAERPPAARDATAVERLKRAGAILLGALNMDEYAYGFTTENTHYGATRNPHDPERVAGGSSGGSAAAVAAGLVPLTLGSDTNGSIRVPAAFCGVFGFKPTYGRISRAGAFLFSSSFDHVGPFARSVRDLALAFDVLQGPDPRDPAVSCRPTAPCMLELDKGTEGLRIAVAEGYFARLGQPEVFEPVTKAARALGVTRSVTITDAEKARAAAYVITACEGANLHLNDLRSRPGDFDPFTIERFLAGALLPAAWYLKAQRFRAVFREKMRGLFESVDVILAPATPCPAIKIGQPTIVIDGVEMPSRPNIGVFTQPLSFIGLPIISVPVFEDGQLPLGVQVIGAPYNESAVLRVAAQLEAVGIARAPTAVPAGSAA
jgi:AtzE family amidohydrolase